MSFISKFFFNREDPEPHIVHEDVPLSTIVRWFIYDTALAEENKIADLLGLNPVSEEGEVMERTESDYRLDNIELLMPFLEQMADISANVLATVQMSESEEATEEDLDLMARVYKVLAISSLIGTFSIATRLGIIVPTGIASEARKMEDFDE
jgi:hypothetical protein